MKTVLEISREINVTPQAVYKKINSLKKELEGLISKGEKGEILINIEGKDIIKQSFKTAQSTSSTVHQQIKQRVDEIDSLVDIQLINLLNKQLEMKDKQIETLTAELKQANEHNREISLALAELNRNQQLLLKQAQDKLLPINDIANKESLFKRLFFNFKKT